MQAHGCLIRTRLGGVKKGGYRPDRTGGGGGKGFGFQCEKLEQHRLHAPAAPATVSSAVSVPRRPTDIYRCRKGSGLQGGKRELIRPIPNHNLIFLDNIVIVQMIQQQQQSRKQFPADWAAAAASSTYSLGFSLVDEEGGGQGGQGGEFTSSLQERGIVAIGGGDFMFASSLEPPTPQQQQQQYQQQQQQQQQQQLLHQPYAASANKQPLLDWMAWEKKERLEENLEMAADLNVFRARLLAAKADQLEQECRQVEKLLELQLASGQEARTLYEELFKCTGAEEDDAAYALLEERLEAAAQQGMAIEAKYLDNQELLARITKSIQYARAGSLSSFFSSPLGGEDERLEEFQSLLTPFKQFALGVTEMGEQSLLFTSFVLTDEILLGRCREGIASLGKVFPLLSSASAASAASAASEPLWQFMPPKLIQLCKIYNF